MNELDVYGYSQVNRATIIWEASVGDPMHLVDIALPDGMGISASRWQRFLINLLKRSIMKQRDRSIRIHGEHYNKAIMKG